MAKTLIDVDEDYLAAVLPDSDHFKEHSDPGNLLGAWTTEALRCAGDPLPRPASHQREPRVGRRRAMRVVSDRLGHGTIAITSDLYTKVYDEVAKDAAERIASMLRN